MGILTCIIKDTSLYTNFVVPYCIAREVRESSTCTPDRCSKQLSFFCTGDFEMGSGIDACRSLPRKKNVSRSIGRAVLSIFRAWSQTPMLGARYIGFVPFRHYSRAHIDVMTNSCILPFFGHHHGWFDGVIGVRFVKYLWGVFSSIKKTLACPLFCPPDW